MANKKGIEISVNEKTEKTLEELSRDMGVNRSELVRHAVEVLRVLRQNVDNGGEVLIKKGDDVQKLVGV